ncbi:MAG: single-stranded DNA-binding protein [candidate division Zixibacteria bacterium]|nr:single-stranded DNA-binding protein [candidate division Zixibacteria bacterium]
MASVNKAILIGNLGKDPDLRYTPSGVAVCTFSIATTEKWKDKNTNEMKETTTWHNIVLWRRQAEIAKEYLQKGSPVYIEGRIQTRSYDDKEGNKKWITEIVGDRLQLLGRRGEAPEPSSAPGPEAQEAPPLTEEDDDLPF